jgi:hypothetical protein
VTTVAEPTRRGGYGTPGRPRHERTALAKMRRLRAAGRSFAAIAKELDAAGVVPPSGTRWQPMTVYRLLKRDDP